VKSFKLQDASYKKNVRESGIDFSEESAIK